jgi:RNA polymerase sigma factor (sigma-70 family)
MEAGALDTSAVLPRLAGRSPLLRLKTDEQLIALTRRGQQGAFEVLVQRYQSRLLAFCRHMLGSTEDAEDVLQEVFTASFNAMLADERPINARPWLYRIARNRCLNHLRRPAHAGQDSMDIFETDGGATTADTVHKREEFRQIVADVQELPETQRTALLLREIDALSYDDIAHAMDTTVPSVKSLLVRARVSLAEAAEARLLTCEEVRLELGQVAEGITRTSAPVRRHLKACNRCRVFRGELRKANRALASVYPLGPLVLVKKFFTAKVGFGAGTASGGSGSAGLAAGGAAAAGGAGAGAGGVLSAGLGAIATKAAAGFAAAAIVTAGAVEVKHAAQPEARHTAAAPALVAQAPQADAAAVPAVAQHVAVPIERHPAPAPLPTQNAKPVEGDVAQTGDTPASTQPADTGSTTTTSSTPPSAPPAGTTATPSDQTTAPTAIDDQPQTHDDTTQEDSSTVSLDSGDGSGSGGDGGGNGSGPSSPPGESPGTPSNQQPAPIVGDPHSPPPGG